MKWLTAFLCLLAISATAQELPPGTIKLPTSLVCGGYNPNIGELQEKEYGELPFLQGPGQVLGPNLAQAYGGNVRMFLNPNNGNFTIYIDIREELTCLIVTGESMTPILTGRPL
jgi:hypothetical protein